MEESNAGAEQAAANSNDREISTPSHLEERLSRTWRHLISSVFHATSKAEQVTTADVASIKEIDEAVVAFLRARLEWGRNLSFLEAKLEGKAKEMEVLQQYSRTQPSLGSRKRKRTKMENDSSSQTVKTSQTAAPPQAFISINPGMEESQPTSTL